MTMVKYELLNRYNRTPTTVKQKNYMLKMDKRDEIGCYKRLGCTKTGLRCRKHKDRIES